MSLPRAALDHRRGGRGRGDRQSRGARAVSTRRDPRVTAEPERPPRPPAPEMRAPKPQAEPSRQPAPGPGGDPRQARRFRVHLTPTGGAIGNPINAWTERVDADRVVLFVPKRKNAGTAGADRRGAGASHDALRADRGAAEGPVHGRLQARLVRPGPTRGRRDLCRRRRRVPHRVRFQSRTPVQREAGALDHLSRRPTTNATSIAAAPTW